MRQTIATLLAVFLLSLTQVAPLQAAVVSTGEVLQQSQQRSERDRLEQTLQRKEVQQQLLSMGVDPAQVQSRVASLTPAEVTALNQRIDELPAGSGLLGTIVFIVLALGVTDMLGITDVYDFIDPIN